MPRTGRPPKPALDRFFAKTHTPASANARKTHCIHGHEFSPDNTAIRNGKRQCITCRRVRDLAYYHARKAAS